MFKWMATALQSEKFQCLLASSVTVYLLVINIFSVQKEALNRPDTILGAQSRSELKIRTGNNNDTGVLPGRKKDQRTQPSQTTTCYYITARKKQLYKTLQ